MPPAPDPAREDIPARDALVRVVRDEGRRVLATLARTVGDVGLAEDAVQDAAVRALQTWPRDGVPANPRAWLTVTARRRAVDILRRERGRGTREAAAMDLLDPAGDVPHRTASSATTCSGWCSPAATRACPWRPRSPSASGPCAG